ncbi:MAG: glycoside hydrolase family 113 [Acidimicrobiales bacterium]
MPDGTQGKVAGMAIPNVSQQQSPNEIARLHSDGLNTVSLFVWWLMDKQNSDSLAPDYKDGTTETDANLELQMTASEQAGMHVILVPIFYCGGCQGGWRGTIAPANPAAWFVSYQGFINHYADIAQSYGATTLFIGSEMTSMENYTSNWDSVISNARTYFSGQIGYEENWDVIGHAKFVSNVDLIGVSAYFPLDSAKSPALSDLLGDWTSSHGTGYSGRNWVRALRQLAATSGKPILFGEVGYMSGDYAANQPFLNYFSTTNWQLQSDLYQALLETFSNEPWWDGVVWWEWFVSSDTTSDNSRTPRGKTAETMLSRWYAQGLRPTNPQTPLAYSLAAFSPDHTEAPRASTSSGSGSADTARVAAAAARTSASNGGPAESLTDRAGAPLLSSGTVIGPSGQPRASADKTTTGHIAAAEVTPSAARGGSLTRRRDPAAALLVEIVLVVAIMAVAVTAAATRTGRGSLSDPRHRQTRD